MRSVGMVSCVCRGKADWQRMKTLNQTLNSLGRIEPLQRVVRVVVLAEKSNSNVPRPPHQRSCLTQQVEPQVVAWRRRLHHLAQAPRLQVRFLCQLLV